MLKFSRSTESIVTRSRPIVIAAALLGVSTAQSRAQGIGERMTKAAQTFAAVTAELAMAHPVVLDLENRGLSTVAVGPVTVGVSQIDIKDDVGVRLHVFYFNATDQAVSVPLPTDDTFVLVDASGRRVQFLSLKVKGSAKSAAELSVPALERVTATVLFYLRAGGAAEAILKVGSSGMIRGIPLRDATAIPAPAVVAPPKDSTSPPKDSTTRPKPPTER